MRELLAHLMEADIFKGASEEELKKRGSVLHDDLSSGDTLGDEWAIFIEDKHFVDEWNLDKETSAYLKKTYGKESEYFIVIHNGAEQHGHGFIKNGKIVQWG